MKILKIKDAYYNLTQYQSFYFHEGTFVLSSYNSGENNGKSIDLGCEEKFTLHNSIDTLGIKNKFDEFLCSNQNMIDFSSVLMPNHVTFDSTNNNQQPIELTIDQPTLDAALLIIENKQVSASFIQRKISVSYDHAAIIVDKLESLKIIGPFESGGSRKVLFNTKADLFEYLNQQEIKRI